MLGPESRTQSTLQPCTRPPTVSIAVAYARHTPVFGYHIIGNNFSLWTGKLRGRLICTHDLCLSSPSSLWRCHSSNFLTFIFTGTRAARTSGGDWGIPRPHAPHLHLALPLVDNHCLFLGRPEPCDLRSLSALLGRRSLLLSVAASASTSRAMNCEPSGTIWRFDPPVHITWVAVTAYVRVDRQTKCDGGLGKELWRTWVWQNCTKASVQGRLF